MSEEFSIRIRGFKSKKQAEMFIIWFCESGEQGLYDWTMDDNYSIFTDAAKTFPIVCEDSCLHMQVKINEEPDETLEE